MTADTAPRSRMPAPARRVPWRRGLGLAAAILLALLVPARPGGTQDGLVPLAELQGNLIAVGVGVYPDHLGSDDSRVGAIPLGHYSFSGQRDVTLLGNSLTVNLLDGTGWRLGPMGMVRFGRSDVDDEVVRRVHEVDPSLELGAFVGYTWASGADPRARVGARAWTLWDVTDSHGGWTVGAGVFGAYPVLKPVTLAGGVGTTYGNGAYMSTNFGVTPADAQASGLPVYQAGAGVRDVRGWVTVLLHLSPRWAIGAGVLYSHLTDEAARSPIVSERGSRNQWLYGVGAMLVW